jgi:hypothetical protein
MPCLKMKPYDGVKTIIKIVSPKQDDLTLSGE